MAGWSERITGVVVLPNGYRVRGRGLRDGLVPGENLPEFGVYLTKRPHVEDRWDSRWVAWPDFRLPRSSPDALATLREAFERAASSRVEIACDGGTGRTGTALAILARYAGVPADDAVRWVRSTYRPRAVETPWQRRFVARAELP
jgi:protein-tyrosine phosphatase